MRWKTLAFACCAILIACGVGAVSYKGFLAGDNLPQRLWGTDDTEMKVVVPGTDIDKDHPISIEMDAERLYGLRLGQPVKVRLVIKSLNSTKVSLETLEAGRLSRGNTTWRIYGKPVLVSQTKKDGFTTRVVDIVVAVWEPPVPPEQQVAPEDGGKAPPEPLASPQSAAASAGGGGDGAGASPQGGPPTAPPGKPTLWPLVLEFPYSVENMANGLPKWDYISTPPIRFGFSSSVEPDAQTFELGPLGAIPDHDVLAAYPLMAGGLALALGSTAYLVALFLAWLRRQRAVPETPAEVKRFKKDMEHAGVIRVSKSYEELVHIAFREFLGDAAKTDEELLAAWRAHPLYDRIEATLAFLNDALHHPGSVSSFDEARARELMDELTAMKEDEVRRAAAQERERTSLSHRLRWIRPSYLFNFNPTLPSNGKEG